MKNLLRKIFIHRKIINIVSFWIIMGIILSLVTYDITVNFDNVHEFYKFVKTGCNIWELNNFVKNANYNDQQNFYHFVNNLIFFPPIGITNEQLTKLNYLASINFIPIYDMLTLFVILLIFFIFFIFHFIGTIKYCVIRYRCQKHYWFYEKVIDDIEYYLGETKESYELKNNK